MNKKILILILVLFFNHCSFNKNNNFWNQTNIKKSDNKKQLFAKVEISNFEINKDLEIDIRSARFTEQSFQNNLSNNNGRLRYDGKFKKALKFNFSKINKFDEFEPELIIDNDSFIFFSNKGTILKFDKKSKLIWKKNHYTKAEKKLKPILFFASNGETLIVADNITKIYALDINTGELIWSKNNSSAFNSEIKIYKDNFYLIDYQNILRSFSIKTGEQVWKVKTKNSILKSQKKLSLVIKNNKIFFNNSIGDITAVDLKTGNLLWIVPTMNSTNTSKSYFLKISNLILNENSIYFSTNMNQFYSIDINTGLINWMQAMNSSLRSTLIEDMIFSVSDNGFLSVSNAKTGEIIRRTNIFNDIKKRKKKKLRATGFVVGKNKIYVSTNNGKIFVVDILNGKTMSSLKIDNNKVSRPFVLNQDLFVIKDNGIIKIQ